MSDPKPIASLGPLLLARKGTAKPAMRAQLDSSARGTSADVVDHLDELSASQEDLGWNDMGDHDMQEPHVVQEPHVMQEPEVRRQQMGLVHRIADSNLVAFKAAHNQNNPEPLRSKEKPVKPVATQSRRAAFTLRLDDERHLKLKLASTVSGESAQQLVTRALDNLLSEMPEIEDLAAQVKRGDKHS
ncbi:hypothetical protein [Alteraurantiacibacter aquimixticola]|uniref:Uncharacterized protein n=1 Tax=Alteraurantiacibacter aquimixticola TaxID=2489173 RepID=A0A4T3F3D4_9SPHN|nr:hypothetical protein [Alteraurantiacibacter aquimixticola]TIX51261.1 hypothetical protein E5222_01990 [Alteraurantiacibacter aquimixticola]